MKTLKYAFLIIDFGFVLYWSISLVGIIPDEYLFKDYYNPISIAWNWSFFPLDMLISATGFSSLWLYRLRNPAWDKLALISLTLCFCSGLMAISFWAAKEEFDISWWAPNLFLMVVPCFYLKEILTGSRDFQG
jgi:hypothetical protein